MACNNSACVVVDDDETQDVIYVHDSKNTGAVQVYGRDRWNGGLAVHFQAILMSDLPENYNLDGSESVSWYKVEHQGLDGDGLPCVIPFYFDNDERMQFLRSVVAREFAKV